MNNQGFTLDDQSSISKILTAHALIKQSQKENDRLAFKLALDLMTAGIRELYQRGRL